MAGLDTLLNKPIQRLNMARQFAQVLFCKMLLRLRQEFDLIIVDAPHVLGASETQALASAFDAVLLLTKTNATSAKQLSEAVFGYREQWCKSHSHRYEQVKLATAALRAYSPESFVENAKGAVVPGQ